MTHDPLNLIESKTEKSFGDQHRNSDGGKIIKIKMYSKARIAEKIFKRKFVEKNMKIQSTYVPDNWPITNEIAEEINWLVNNKMALV